MEKEYYLEIIEPPIYSALNWEMSLIMKTLEYLRQKLPDYLTEIPSSTNYHLVVFYDKFQNPYPVIGVGSSDRNVMEEIPNFNDLFDRVNDIVEKEFPLEKLKKEIENIQVLSWEKLLEVSIYPNY